MIMIAQRHDNVKTLEALTFLCSKHAALPKQASWQKHNDYQWYMVMRLLPSIL